MFCEDNLVGDASEGEGEFLYLRLGRVVWYVGVYAENAELVIETGVLLFESRGVVVEMR